MTTKAKPQHSPATPLRLAEAYVTLDRTLISGEEILSLAREVVHRHKVCSKLVEALRAFAALDDGDRQYWWHGRPAEAQTAARTLLKDLGEDA